ncbi:MAG TPA: sialidase family protein [Gemmatimonadaceae bacterium]
MTRAVDGVNAEAGPERAARAPARAPLLLRGTAPRICRDVPPPDDVTRSSGQALSRVIRRATIPALGILAVFFAPFPAATRVKHAKAGRQSAPAAAPLTIGRNVQVSASLPSTMHGEGMIVADPTGAGRLLVCAMLLDERRGEGVVAYASTDGGATWSRTFETPPDEFVGDPACAFGPDGEVYLTMMPSTIASMQKMRLPLFRSRDGGHTWERAHGIIGGVDRESIVVDGTGGRFHNRLYVHGSAQIRGSGRITRSTIALYASSDGGHTFGPRAEWAALGRSHIFSAGNAVVLPDGRWLTVFTELRNFFDSAGGMAHAPSAYASPPEPERAWVKAISSDDGGDTLNEPVIVSGRHLPNAYVRLSGVAPVLVADVSHGPFGGRVYAAWGDARFGGTDILLSHSSDRGQTWSAPIVVNDDAPTKGMAPAVNHLMPAIAVNRAGVLAVTWLDRRDAKDGLGWRQRIRVSLDGGDTFLPSEVVSEAPARFDGLEHWPAQAGTTGGGTPSAKGGLLRMLIYAPRFLYMPGDYAGLSADAAGTFHPYWIDNRTGWHQIWTAAVQIAADAVKYGSAALSSLEDLTPLVTLERVRAHYDRASATASVTVRLRNTGTRTLTGPFVLRLTTLDSDVARVEAIDTANGVAGAGATWDLTRSVQGSRLESGAVSARLTLRFRLHDVRPFVQGHTDRFDLRLVTFSARVLGMIDSGPHVIR